MEDFKFTGAFFDSLKRTNKEIRNDRAAAITEDLEMSFRRTIEDMRMELRKLKNSREGMLDMSPSNKMMIINVNDFDPTLFVEKEKDFARKIRDKKILLDLMEERYEYLFGEKGAPADTTPVATTV